MIGMALFQGLFDREARVLEKVNHLVQAGVSALDAGAEARAAGAFVEALRPLPVPEPVSRDRDDADGCARVLALSPQEADLWVRKADAHRRRNEPDEAQSAYDRALRIDSDRKDALEGKSLTYLATGEPQRALRCLDRVIQVDPYDPNAWRLRGDVLAASNQNEEALRSYDEALRQRDADAKAWVGP